MRVRRMRHRVARNIHTADRVVRQSPISGHFVPLPSHRRAVLTPHALNIHYAHPLHQIGPSKEAQARGLSRSWTFIAANVRALSPTPAARASLATTLGHW